jgi:hypothetical protein
MVESSALVSSTVLTHFELRMYLLSIGQKQARQKHQDQSKRHCFETTM